MLISPFLYISITLTIVLAVIVWFARYKKHKRKAVSSSIQFLLFCFILAFIFGFILFPRVHIINDSGYKKRILIGIASVKLNNGDDVYMSSSCVINNSSRTLYVETIRYMYSSGYSGMYNVEEIPPCTVYHSGIDYAFETPPQNIMVSIFEAGTFTKKWLREKSFYEE